MSEMEMKIKDQLSLPMEAVVDQSFNAVLITDASFADDGPHIKYANKAFCRMTGYELDELLERNPRMLQGELTDKSVIARLKESLHSEQNFFGNTINYRKDGSPYEVEWCVSPIHDEAGQLRQFISIQKDVSSSSQVLKSLNKVNKELRNKKDKQAVMFSVIGHELRTPLSAIKMLLDDLDTPDTNPQQVEISRIVESMINTLDDLRYVAQPEAIKLKSTISTVPYELLESSLYTLNHLAKEHKLNIHMKGDEISGQSFVMNAQAVRQVITNLVKNAAIHAQATDLWAEIKGIQHDTNRFTLTLIIEDNGVGIHGPKRDALFDAFVRGNSDADGTGLGLFIINELADQLDANINYFDSDKGGAGFNLTFDVNLEDNSNDIDSSALPEQSLKELRVLFAEDQPTLRMLTLKQLEKQGAIVLGVRDGQEALDAIAKGDVFDLVLTDINMPNINGYGLTTSLRERGFNGKIIGVTAATLSDDTERLIAAGADSVLSKPINMQAVKQELWRLENCSASA